MNQMVQCIIHVLLLEHLRKPRDFLIELCYASFRYKKVSIPSMGMIGEIWVKQPNQIRWCWGKLPFFV